ncbi:MAG: molybdopterin-dependent oxidoreductase [Hahellaceae bacterium]|nr:molybdopterin-dependent oxidoreductase [Hahellaceae bacterium]
MNNKTYPSICRLCTASCPVTVEFDGQTVTSAKGIKSGAPFHGFFCKRGQSLPDHIHHPDRLLYSLKRQPDGSFERIKVEIAIAEIAEKLNLLIANHGPNSIATYMGTFSGVYPLAAVFAQSWMAAIQSTMIFSSMTIDQPGKGVAANLLGRWLAGPQPFKGSDVCMLIGGNPLISYAAGNVPFQNPAKHLTSEIKAGMKLIVIDPRYTETARRAHIHLQPRPGEDASILAAIIHTIISEELTDSDFISANVAGFSHLKSVVAEFTPAYAATRADVPEQLINVCVRATCGL